MTILAQNVEQTVTQWVSFSLGDECYGTDVMDVQEVLRVTEIAPVPGAPSYVIGIINLRGSVVTVVNTRTLFGLMPRDIDDSSRIIIIEVEQKVLGILVDSVAEVVDIPQDAVEAPPNVGNDESSRYIQGIYTSGDTMLILIELNQLLSDDEWSDIAAF